MREMGLWQGVHMAEDCTMNVPENGGPAMRITSGLVPVCPLCGKPMTMNLRADDTFVEDEGWHAAAERYHRFLERYADRRMLLFELGVGGNTPGIIKYPFWRMANRNTKATYACITLGEAYAPREITARSVCWNADVGDVLAAVRD